MSIGHHRMGPYNAPMVHSIPALCIFPWKVSNPVQSKGLQCHFDHQRGRMCIHSTVCSVIGPRTGILEPDVRVKAIALKSGPLITGRRGIESYQRAERSLIRDTDTVIRTPWCSCVVQARKAIACRTVTEACACDRGDFITESPDIGYNFSQDFNELSDALLRVTVMR